MDYYHQTLQNYEQDGGIFHESFNDMVDIQKLKLYQYHKGQIMTIII